MLIVIDIGTKHFYEVEEIVDPALTDYWKGKQVKLARGKWVEHPKSKWILIRKDNCLRLIK